MLTQGKDDNEAGREKDKQETANISDREYMDPVTAGDGPSTNLWLSMMLIL